MAEAALIGAMTDPGQLAATTDLSLCHGCAELLHIARGAATDAITPELAACHACSTRSSRTAPTRIALRVAPMAAVR